MPRVSKIGSSDGGSKVATRRVHDENYHRKKSTTIVRLHWARGVQRIELRRPSLRVLEEVVFARTGISPRDQDLYLDAEGATPVKTRDDIVNGVQIYLFGSSSLVNGDHNQPPVPCKSSRVSAEIFWRAEQTLVRQPPHQGSISEQERLARRGNILSRDFKKTGVDWGATQGFIHAGLSSIDRDAFHTFWAPTLGSLQTGKDGMGRLGLMIGRQGRQALPSSLNDPLGADVYYILEDDDFERGSRVAKALGFHVVGCIFDGSSIRSQSDQETLLRRCASIQLNFLENPAFVLFIALAIDQCHAFALKDFTLAYLRDCPEGPLGRYPFWSHSTLDVGPVKTKSKLIDMPVKTPPFRDWSEDLYQLERRTLRRLENALFANSVDALETDFHFWFHISVIFGHGAVKAAFMPTVSLEGKKEFLENLRTRFLERSKKYYEVKICE